MQIPLINKKQIVLLALLAAVIFSAFSLLYYRHKQKQWLLKKQAIENQKAEEINIRIIEGWSNKEIAAYLEKQGIISAADFLRGIKNFDTKEYDNFLPQQAKGDLQGFLYPDSYRLFKSISDRSLTPADEASKTIIKKLLDTFKKRLPANTEALAKKQGLSLYEAITLASIIENETGRNAVSAESKAKLDEERRIVAGIFYNRLNAGMALQSDATINYFTGKNDPSPLLEDLEKNSPYNTYKNPGLPPGPICNPSLASIKAVLNPKKTDYYYFLHVQPGGQVLYSKTFEEHVQKKLQNK
jgi:UPF0755 protein